MKEGLVRKNAAAPDMEQIGRYTRRAYSPEEVYTFSLVLCDNEVDRDFERFSREALVPGKDSSAGSPEERRKPDSPYL